MPLRAWQHSLWTSVIPRHCARMRFLKVPAWPCMTFASVHPSAQSNLFSSALLSCPFTASPTCPNRLIQEMKGRYFQLSREKFRTISQSGGKKSKLLDLDLYIIWAILLISCPPYKVSLKVISSFSLEGEFCDYSSLLHTTEFFLPPTYLPVWKNGADKASFTHEDSLK